MENKSLTDKQTEKTKEQVHAQLVNDEGLDSVAGGSPALVLKTVKNILNKLCPKCYTGTLSSTGVCDKCGYKN